MAEARDDKRGEGVAPLEEIKPGEAVDLCGRLEAGHRLASATAYHRAAAWERLARALAKSFDAFTPSHEQQNAAPAGEIARKQDGVLAHRSTPPAGAAPSPLAEKRGG